MEKNNKKTILITGGAGFIGSHLCKRLLSNGHKVICLDNLFTGSEQNILEFRSNNDFKFIKHDIENTIFLDNIDEIYNLACPASPIHYQSNPIKTTKTCTIGVINLLELAKRNNAKILQASTSEVYGDPNVHPQNEKYWGNVNPVGIRSCYDEGKRCAETLFMDYRREHKLNTRIVRIFNTYGPNMNINDGRVVSNFITQALNADDITMYGDGNQTRSFQYVDDLIDGMIKLMGSSYFEPVNIGNPIEMTMKDLALSILKLTNSNSKIVFKELPMDDPKRRKPNIDLAKSKLNWEPSVSIELGLTKTIGYFRDLL